MKHKIGRSLTAAAMAATALTGAVTNAQPAAAATGFPCGHDIGTYVYMNGAHQHAHTMIYKGHYNLSNGTHWHKWTDIGPRLGTEPTKNYAYQC